MTTTVGPTGEIVIDQAIRDRLQIEPGWLAIQRLVDGHVEVYFLPPEHNQPSQGALSQYTSVRFPDHDALEEAIARSWEVMTEEEAAEWRERES